MIDLSTKGRYKKTENFLNKLKCKIDIKRLEHYGKEGVEALKNATPKDTGKTSESWHYRITQNEKRRTVSLSFYNTNLSQGIPIALLIQYGHGTKNGVYVEGIDYINPAIQPIFEKIKKSIWEEVMK